MTPNERIEKERQAIADAVLAQIEGGNLEWTKGWHCLSQKTFNAKTERAYQGTNLVILYLRSMEKGYQDPRWLTFNQAKELGAKIKAGEHATTIFHWNEYDKKTGKVPNWDDINKLPAQERVEYERENIRHSVSYHNVFNAAQVDGLAAYPAAVMSADEIAKQNSFIEQIISASAAPVIHDGGGSASYNPATDTIHLPKLEDFKTKNDYYATALHEIAHSTGHESRLFRKLSAAHSGKGYAVEELRAEFAALFLQAELGITLDGSHFENHSAYIQNWASAIKEDKNILFAAIKDAGDIASWIKENYANKELTADKMATESPNEIAAISANTVLVNLFAGPAAGKTTCAMEIATELKKAGLTVEYVSEYAKELVYAGDLEKLKDQEAVTGEQIRRLNLPKGQVDVVVTDSPILLGEIYGKNNSPEFSAKLRQAHNSFENFNLFINRGSAFQQEGRIHNEAESKAIDKRIKDLLRANHIYFGVYDHKAIDLVIRNIKTRLNTLQTKEKKIMEDVWEDGNIVLPPSGVDDALYDGDYERNKIEPLAVKRETDKAVLVQLEIAGADKPKDTWLPKSQVTLDVDGKNVIAVNNYLQEKYGNILSKQKEIAAVKVGKKVNFDYKYNYDEAKNQTHIGVTADGQPVYISGRISANPTAEEIKRINETINTAAVKQYGTEKQEGKLSGVELAKKINAEHLNNIEKNVPAAMKALPNWCVLKLYKDKEADPPRYKKFIVNAGNPAGGWANHKDPATWTTFDKALEYARVNGGAGLSFAINGSGFNAFDLDHCYDKETRTYNDTAKKFLEQLPESYAERSVSGTGLHVFTKSQICENGKYNESRGDKTPIEVFETWGFVSMTGNIVDQKHKNLTELPEGLKTEIQNQIGEKRQYAATQRSAPSSVRGESDNEIITKISRSKRADEFRQMMSGANINGDHSKTDARMMNILAYFSHSDQAQMERIFRSSGLYRSKEKSDDYVRRTAEYAIKTLGKNKDK
jgi:antirestriction protein ArdC